MNFILKNWRYKFLALVAAIIFWAFVVTAGAPIFKFPEAIEIKPFNLSEQLIVSNTLGKANLILRASPETYKSLKDKDFEVFVDLKGLGKGEYETEILVTSKNPEVTVLEIIPSKIKVNLEQLNFKTVPLSLMIEGKPADGYAKGEARLDITSVKINGAENLLNVIQEAKVAIKLNGQEKADILKKIPIKIIDIHGLEVINGLQLTPLEAEVYIPVFSVIQQKTVGVKVNLINPSNISWVSKISVNPSTVTIKGDQKDLDKIDYLETEAVDLTDLQIQKTKRVKLKLPSGIEILRTESQWVTVSAEITEYQNNQKVTANIKYVNLEDNYTATFDPANINLEISGDLDELTKLKSTDYYVSLDLKGIKEETTINLTTSNIILPEKIKLKDFNPKQILVRMEKNK